MDLEAANCGAYPLFQSTCVDAVGENNTRVTAPALCIDEDGADHVININSIPGTLSVCNIGSLDDDGVSNFVNIRCRYGTSNVNVKSNPVTKEVKHVHLALYIILNLDNLKDVVNFHLRPCKICKNS